MYTIPYFVRSFNIQFTQIISFVFVHISDSLTYWYRKMPRKKKESLSIASCDYHIKTLSRHFLSVSHIFSTQIIISFSLSLISDNLYSNIIYHFIFSFLWIFPNSDSLYLLPIYLIFWFLINFDICFWLNFCSKPIQVEVTAKPFCCFSAPQTSASWIKCLFLCFCFDKKFLSLWLYNITAFPFCQYIFQYIFTFFVNRIYYLCIFFILSDIFKFFIHYSKRYSTICFSGSCLGLIKCRVERIKISAVQMILNISQGFTETGRLK